MAVPGIIYCRCICTSILYCLPAMSKHRVVKHAYRLVPTSRNMYLLYECHLRPGAGKECGCTCSCYPHPSPRATHTYAQNEDLTRLPGYTRPQAVYTLITMSRFQSLGVLVSLLAFQPPPPSSTAYSLVQDVDHTHPLPGKSDTQIEAFIFPLTYIINEFGAHLPPL